MTGSSPGPWGRRTPGAAVGRPADVLVRHRPGVRDGDHRRRSRHRAERPGCPRAVEPVGHPRPVGGDRGSGTADEEREQHLPVGPSGAYVTRVGRRRPRSGRSSQGTEGMAPWWAPRRAMPTIAASRRPRRDQQDRMGGRTPAAHWWWWTSGAAFEARPPGSLPGRRGLHQGLGGGRGTRCAASSRSRRGGVNRSSMLSSALRARGTSQCRRRAPHEADPVPDAAGTSRCRAGCPGCPRPPAAGGRGSGGARSRPAAPAQPEEAALELVTVGDRRDRRVRGRDLDRVSSTSMRWRRGRRASSCRR